MDARRRAHEAFAQRAWQTAFDAFEELGALEPLDADDHDVRAETAHWLGFPDISIAAHSEAYGLHVSAGHRRKAALSAFMLTLYMRLRGEGAQADAWLARCERLLAEEADEGPEHGYPLYLTSARLMGSDLEAAVATAQRMQELGQRYGDDTLVALGVFFEGRARIKQARVREGLALLDEAMLAALSDALKPMWTGAIYCGLLDACHELGDVRRAREWTAATSRWCEPLPVASLYPGICRVHRAEVLQVHGAWAEAEAEALGACQDMVGIDVFVVADGWYEVGEIRRRRGDLPGAEAAYAMAHEGGRDPQPGLALLRLAQGKVDVAAASIAATLAGFGGSRLERAPLLAAQVEIALAAGDIELAQAGAQELIATAEAFDSTILRAAGHCRVGAVALAQGQAVTALAALRMASTVWQEIDAPYDLARCRVLLAEAYRQLDDADAAARELAAARACFERLGAAADLQALDGRTPTAGGLTDREVEVLRLIATGQTNREIAAVLIISERTVARHVSNIFTKLGLSSRSAATAYAFANNLVTAPALRGVGENAHAPPQDGPDGRCARRAPIRMFLLRNRSTRTKGEHAMPKYVIERELPGAGSLSADELHSISAKSNQVLADMAPRAHWQQSYVTGDKVYCVYIAENEDTVREHAEAGGFPVNAINEVSAVIDPSSGE